jgi:PCRF domain
LLPIMLCIATLTVRRIRVLAWVTATTTTKSSRIGSRYCSEKTKFPLIGTELDTHWSTTTRRLLSTPSSSSSSSSSYSEDALVEAKRRFQLGCELHEKNSASIPPTLDQILRDFETESSAPSFWDADQKERNTYVTSQISYYSRLSSRVAQWNRNREDCEVALEMLTSSSDDDDSLSFSAAEKQSLLEEFQTSSTALLEDGERFQLELLLSGPYDHQPCRLLITAGAGGTEANDWVADLKRMYERHAEKMGFSITIEDVTQGDVVGYKSVELILSGGPGHPYGW